MKFGRLVDCGDGVGKTRMIDVVTLPDVLPSWAADAGAWLATMYANDKPVWDAAGQWFVAVPEGVQPCAVHTGENCADPLSYLNLDRTAGDGLTSEQREALEKA